MQNLLPFCPDSKYTCIKRITMLEDPSIGSFLAKFSKIRFKNLPVSLFKVEAVLVISASKWSPEFSTSTWSFQGSDRTQKASGTVQYNHRISYCNCFVICSNTEGCGTQAQTTFPKRERAWKKLSGGSYFLCFRIPILKFTFNLFYFIFRNLCNR